MAIGAPDVMLFIGGQWVTGRCGKCGLTNQFHSAGYRDSWLAYHDSQVHGGGTAGGGAMGGIDGLAMGLAGIAFNQIGQGLARAIFGDPRERAIEQRRQEGEAAFRQYLAIQAQQNKVRQEAIETYQRWKGEELAKHKEAILAALNEFENEPEGLPTLRVEEARGPFGTAEIRPVTTGGEEIAPPPPLRPGPLAPIPPAPTPIDAPPTFRDPAMAQTYRDLEARASQQLDSLRRAELDLHEAERADVTLKEQIKDLQARIEAAERNAEEDPEAMRRAREALRRTRQADQEAATLLGQRQRTVARHQTAYRATHQEMRNIRDMHGGA